MYFFSISYLGFQNFKEEISDFITEQYETPENLALKNLFMKDLNINDGRKITFIGHSENKSFMFLQVAQVGGGSYYIIVKNIDGKWVSVGEGQEYQICETVNKYQIPSDMQPICLDLNNKEIQNTIN